MNWAFLPLLVSSSFCVADTLYVPTSTPLASVIASSASGDWIILEPGTHQGPIIPYGRDLTIGSRYLLDGDTLWIHSTVVTANPSSGDTGSTAVYAYGESSGSKLAGLSLVGANGTWNEQVDALGGGCIYVDQTSPLVEKCRMSSGHSVYGGAVFAVGLPFLRNSHAKVLDSEIADCEATAFGGGAFASHCTLTVEATRLVRLTCNVAAGAIDAQSCHITIDSSVVDSCFGVFGGIKLVGGWGAVTFCSFLGNRTSESGFCTALSASGFWGEVQGCYFLSAGALWPCVHLGGNVAHTVFAGNVLEDNSTSVVTGTLILNEQNDNVVSHNIFRNNHNLHGGAVYAFQDADAVVEFNTFVGNSSEDLISGSVLRSVTRGNPLFVNNIIAANFGNCIDISPTYPLQIDARNNWWGSASGPYHPARNPMGQGDTLLADSVLFEPWLTAPPDTSLPSSVTPRLDTLVSSTWDLQGVYPNPFNNEFSVSIAGFTGQSFTLSLFNILGQKQADLYQGAVVGSVLSFVVSAEISSGIYFLVAHDSRFRESLKVVLLK